MALSLRSPNPYIMSLESSTSELTSHPFQTGLSLTKTNQSPGDQVTTALRAAMRNPLIGIRSMPSSSGFGLVTSTQTIEYKFHVGGIPICQTYARAHIQSDGATLILGKIPQIDDREPVPPHHASDWPDLELAVSNAAKTFEEASDVNLKSSQRCFLARHGQLLHAYDLLLTVDGLPWTALADGYELFARAPAFFDVTGSARVHPNNILTGVAAEVKLKNLIGDGSLTSEFLTTVVPTGYPPAQEASHLFYYNPAQDRRYDEVAAFYYVQRHHSFLQSLGFEWYGPKPLVIRLHVKPAGRSNNALFIPAINEGDLPSISVDDGDGIELQYLASDADVVAHEFGHHVVYRSIRSTEGESLVLHEGLADFFAFARSGDACLGESICPEGTGACVIPAPNACLRSAELNLRYNDSMWEQWAGPRNRLGHLHGQVVSGMLWDLRRSRAIPAEELTRLVLRAVSYFKSDSGLRDLMLALFFADRDLFGSKYFSRIYDAGQARGLGDFYADVEKTGGKLPEIIGGGLKPDEATDTMSSTSEKRGKAGTKLSCGVTGNQGLYDAAAILVIAIPLLLGVGAAALRPALARAKSGKRKRKN